jgi:hypothetical protein
MSEEEEQEEEQEAAVKMYSCILLVVVHQHHLAAQNMLTRRPSLTHWSSADIFTKASSKLDKAQTSWKAGEP